MSVAMLLRSMSAEELSEWQEFWTLEAAERKQPVAATSEADGD